VDPEAVPESALHGTVGRGGPTRDGREE
jgi:hypothetical protein